MEQRSHELEVKAARVALGGRDVLRGIDVALPRGEVLALLGASGCGKTTLLRAIAGLTALDAGTISIHGADVTQVPAQQRGVGVVFQHYALFPNLTVLENVKFGVLADRRTQDEAERRARRLLALVGLEAEAARRPARLSGGQRQRVALARALAREPSLLLMDEPFSALDESFRVPLRRAFRALQRTLDQSCLVVTHDREEAFELADRVAVMFDGRIEQCASPEDLWRRPATRRVADFLGAFNVLPAAAAPGASMQATGHLAIPIAACRLDGGLPLDATTHWRIEAVLQGTYVGPQRVTAELRTAAGDALVLWCEHGTPLPEPGARCAVSVPAASVIRLDA
jgi:ABC-type Fe3+/spermidine/putrescine transport system ATPase subunit